MIRLPFVSKGDDKIGLNSGFWGLADQALCSASNFATMVIVARALAPAEFGAFVIVYMALQFAGSMQQALIARPHNVLASNLKGAAFDSYTAYSATAQLVLAGIFGGAAILAGGLVFAAGGSFAGLLVALGSATFAWQLQEFVRQVRYTQGEAREVFLLDVVSYAGQAFIIAAFWGAGLLSGTNALYAIGFTSAVSAAWGLYRLGLPERGISMLIIRRNWDFGKWLAVEGIGQWLSTQIYPVIAAAILGLGAAGQLKALQNLVAPVHIILNAFISIAVPRAARAYQTGSRRALFAYLVPMALLTAVPLVAYWGLIGVVGGKLLTLLYTESYQTDAQLIWLFNASYAALFFVQASSVGLMAMENSRGIVTGRIVAVALTATLGVALTWQFGLAGMLIANTVTLLAMGMVLVYQLRERGEGIFQPSDRERLLAALAARGSR